jgi:CheY-like chemotaxis protein
MAKKILLADDSLTIQKVVELTLAGTGHELTCVSNGQRALERIRESRPDLILADVVMPEKNGYEVCEAVKSNPATARIPVVLLSGAFEPFDRERAERLGCDLVVSKPFDAQQLLGEIDALLARGAAGSEPRRPEEEGPFETGTADDAHGAPDLALAEADGPFDAGRLASEASEAAPASAGWIELAGSPAAPPPVQEPMPPLPEPPPAAAAGLDAPDQIDLTIEGISADEAEIAFNEAVETATNVPAPPPPPAAPGAELTEEQVERIAARVLEKLSDRVVREVAWEVVPDMAEIAVKRRIAELESGGE